MLSFIQFMQDLIIGLFFIVILLMLFGLTLGVMS